MTQNFKQIITTTLAAATLLTASFANAFVILPPGATWEYTFTDPTADTSWNTTTGGWTLGAAPFGNQGSGDFGFNTYWAADGRDGDDLWARVSLDLTLIDLSSLAWDLGVDNGYKLYMNGALVSAANAEGYTNRWEYSGGFGGTANQGINVLAVALEDHGGATAFDMQVTGNERLLPPKPPVAAPAPAVLWLIAGGLGLFGLVRRKV